MTTKKAIALGCGIAAAVAVAAVVVIVCVIAYMAQDVKGMAVTVDGPTDVKVGESFDLTVTVTNERPRKVLSLSDVDIAEEYLAGFTVGTITPTPKSNKHVPVDNSRSFTFNVKIPPHQAQTFTFNLRAEKAGLFRGDVDVCEGARFTTGMAQTSVKEK